MSAHDPRSPRPRGFRDATESHDSGPRSPRGFESTKRDFEPESFAEEDGALFSAQELQQLVLGEVLRAERQVYSLACLRVAVDRIDSLQDIYGRQARQEIVQSLVGFLARDLRGSDFVGHLKDGSLLCLLPQATPEGLRGVAGRLLRGARSLVFQSGRKQVHITVSIGIAHAAPGDRQALASLKASADAGLSRSANSGGDRLFEVCLATERREAERKEQEREQRRWESERAGREQEAARAAQAAAEIHKAHESGVAHGPATPAGLDPKVLLDLIRQALSEHSGAIEAVRRSRAQPRPSGENRGQVDILERRVSKLAAELERYQSQLLKLSPSEPDDVGVRSFGKMAGREDSLNTSKLEMMGEIFKANLALKDALANTPPAESPEGDADQNPANPPPSAP